VKLVLDTNVVIDWLVFDDPFLAAFREAVLARQITILTHAPAIEELRRVLAYKALKLDSPRQALVIERYLAQTSPLSDALPLNDAREASGVNDVPLPKGFPRCRDPDDAPFLSLAWRAKADALVSRDNEVLALRRRAMRFGFRILDVPQMVETIRGCG
jgi:uncharacterized protein